MKATVELRELQLGTDELSVRLTAETPEEETRLFHIHREVISSARGQAHVEAYTVSSTSGLSTLTLAAFRY